MPRDACVYSRPGRPHWFVIYFCPRRLKRVAEVTAWRVDDPAGRKHAFKFAQQKSEEAGALRGARKAEAWGVWVGKFFDDRYRANPLTRKRATNAWDWLAVWLEEEQAAVPAALTYAHVLRYPDWRTKKKRHCGKFISRNTALTELKFLGVVMRESVRRGFALSNPCERLGLRRDPAREKPEISAAEIAEIRSELHRREQHLPVADRWMSNCFAVALHQGCRLSETAVPLTAIDEGRGTIQFHAKGRNGQPHIFTTALHDGLRPLVKELRAAKASHTCRLPQMPAKAWHDLFASLELGHLCFHCTRVTVITRLARGGVSQQQAMRFVGHASGAVHRIYQRLQAEDLSACTAALKF